MRKMLLIISLAVAAVSISVVALAYQPGFNTRTGTPAPQYSAGPGGGMALEPYNPGITPSTGMPNPPASLKSYGTTDGIEPYNPGLNPSVVGQSKPGPSKPAAPK